MDDILLIKDQYGDALEVSAYPDTFDGTAVELQVVTDVDNQRMARKYSPAVYLTPRDIKKLRKRLKRALKAYKAKQEQF